MHVFQTPGDATTKLHLKRPQQSLHALPITFVTVSVFHSYQRSTNSGLTLMQFLCLRQPECIYLKTKKKDATEESREVKRFQSFWALFKGRKSKLPFPPLQCGCRTRWDSAGAVPDQLEPLPCPSWVSICLGDAKGRRPLCAQDKTTFQKCRIKKENEKKGSSIVELPALLHAGCWYRKVGNWWHTHENLVINHS